MSCSIINDMGKSSNKRTEKRTVFAVLLLTVILFVCATVNTVRSTSKDIERINILYQNAAEYEENKIYYDALQCYLEINDIQKNNYDCLIKISQMYRKLGDEKNMLSYNETAKKTSPEKAAAYEMMAQYYNESGAYTEAYSEITAASDIGVNSEYLNNLNSELFGKYTEKYVSYDSIFPPVVIDGKVLWSFEYNGKYGICDSDGNKIIKPVYDWIGTVDEQSGLIACESDGELCYIDIKGNRRVSVSENYKLIGNFGNGYAPVRKNDNYGYIDRKLNEYKFIYDYAGAFSNGIAAVKKGKNWGIINSDLYSVTGYVYDSILTDAYGFCAQYGMVIALINGNHSFIDISGNQISDRTFFDARLPASDNEPIAVRIDEKSGWSFSNRKGEIVLNTEYEDAGSFSCGLAPVYRDGKWGYIDTDGNLIIDCIFNGATEFSSDGTAAVKKYTNWYFIRLCRFQK